MLELNMLIDGLSAEALMRGEGFAPTYPEPFDLELAFTRAYQEASGGGIIGRELACLGVLYPAVFQPIQSGDVLAGRVRIPMVGVSAESGGLGYYCKKKLGPSCVLRGHGHRCGPGGRRSSLLFCTGAISNTSGGR